MDLSAEEQGQACQQCCAWAPKSAGHVKCTRLLACKPLGTLEEALDQACFRSRSWAAEGAVQNVT